MATLDDTDLGIATRELAAARHLSLEARAIEDRRDRQEVERTIANGPKLSAGVIIPKKGLLEMKKVLESGPSCKLAMKVVTSKLALAIRTIDLVVVRRAG